MAAKLYNFEVSHYEYGTVIVEAISPETATVQAAKRWEAPWAQIAGYCSVRRLGTAAKPRCRRCHSEFGGPGDVQAYCPACLQAMDLQRREMARRRGPDRRAGVREK